MGIKCRLSADQRTGCPEKWRDTDRDRGCQCSCHMPDVLEMPYLPPLLGTDETEESGITVRLGGPTCLSGDVIGDYKFRQLPEYGELLMFGDMAIYTTCKNNTFNGMPLPDIWLRHGDNTMQQLTDFGYMDFKERLGSRD